MNKTALSGGLLFLMAFAASCSTSSKAQYPVPDASHSPEEVVGFQLDLLARASGDFSSLESAFAFAAPSNRARFGNDPERFAQIFFRPPFDIMVEAVESDILGSRSDEQYAAVSISVSADEETRYFLWVLQRQNEGEYSGAWMTIGVEPEAPPSSQSDRLL